MSTIRQVAKGSSPPVGGSVSSDAGDLPLFSAIDHVHSFWSKWYEVSLLRGYTGQLLFSTCGNMVWIRGEVDRAGSLAQSSHAAVLPKIIWPDRIIRIGNIEGSDEGVEIDSDGKIFGASPTIVDNVGNRLFTCDDLIYRTIR